jgi:hypothetical protein
MSGGSMVCFPVFSATCAAVSRTWKLNLVSPVWLVVFAIVASVSSVIVLGLRACSARCLSMCWISVAV